MNELMTISAVPGNGYPDYIGFPALRQAGFNYIAAFSGKLWTDHNIHDPGITMLEALCYVLTDLDYRTKLDFKDLITGKKGKDDNFFTPAQILGNNPLTIMDYRKLLIDIRGVRNAWLEPIHPYQKGPVGKDKTPGTFDNEHVLTYDCQTKVLSAEPGGDEQHPVPLRGLYRVYIEPDDIYPSAFDKNECGIAEFNQSYVIEEINKRLHGHRNLCEDFTDIILLRREMISFCLHVELKNDADPEEVLTAIFSMVREFFSPAPHFYSLPQLLEKGRTMDEIFEGRPFDFENDEPIQQMGFIDTAELNQLQRHRVIHVSDLYRIILEIPGIEGITRLVLMSNSGGIQTEFNEGEEWCLALQPHHRPVLDPALCNVIFFKNKLQFTIDGKTAADRFLHKVSDFNKSEKKESKLLDGVIPRGRELKLSAYKSVQYEFPRNYFIGKNEVPVKASPLRKAQSLQLQAYLLFYDRLLADYFSQLSNIRQLFSFRTPPGNGQSYFHSDLNGTPNLPILLRGYPSSQTSGNPQRYNGMKLAFEPLIIEDEDPLKRKARFYHSFLNREEAIGRLVTACASGNLRPAAAITKEGHFYFTILDHTNTILLQSAGACFPSQEEALRTAQDVLFLGGINSCYYRINDRETGRYGFDLAYQDISYTELMNEINEPQLTYLERRDGFLNHLLSRFAEDFTDYSLMMYALNGKKNSLAQTVRNKEEYLTNIPDLSANRGRAFDYYSSQQKFPVSGLQRKVGGLMGIYPDPDTTLNNFDPVTLHECYMFCIYIPGDEKGDTPLFESKSFYKTGEEAMQAGAHFLSLAKDVSNYRDFCCREDGVYGFKTQYIEGNSWIDVTCNLRHLEPLCSDDDLKKWIAGFVEDNGIKKEFIQLRQGHYFIFMDDAGAGDAKSSELLKSTEGYANNKTAQLAALACLNILQAEENWKINDPEEQDRYFIGIVEPVHNITVARHPVSFDSTEEAIVVRKKLIEFFRQKHILYKRHELEVNNWHYQIGDVNSWKSSLVYKNATIAIHSAVQFIDLAGEAENYLPLEHLPGSWQLTIIRKQIVRGVKEPILTEIAGSDDRYPGEQEARQAIESSAERFKNLWIELDRFIKSEDTSIVDFVDADDPSKQALISSTDPVPTGSRGNDITGDIKKRAANPDLVRILPVTGSEKDCHYHVAVINQYGRPLAVSAGMECELAKSLRNRVISLAGSDYLNGESRPLQQGWYFQWGTATSILLQSLRLYHESATVLDALAGLLINFSEYPIELTDNLNGKYGYLISRPGEEPVGRQATWFDNAADRDEAIIAIRASVDEFLMQHRFTINSGKNYFFSISGDNNEILLQEARPEADEAEIQLKFYQSCQLGKNDRYYHRFKIANCIYGFEVRNEHDLVIAKHPKEYCTEAERDDALDHCRDYLKKHAATITIKYLAGSWRYNWQWINCHYLREIALEGLDDKPDKAAAEEALRIVLEQAKKRDAYELVEENKKWRIYLLGKSSTNRVGKRIAVHPTGYTCKKYAERIIEKLIEWTAFQLDKNIVTEKITTVAESHESDEQAIKGFRLWDRDLRLARYYRSSPDRKKAIQLIRQAWLYAKKHPVIYTLPETGSGIIVEADKKFYYQLIDKGALLWQSVKGYDDAGSAMTAFRENFFKILDLSRNKALYSAYKPGVTELQLSDENQQAVAFHKQSFKSASEWEDAVLTRIQAGNLYPVFKRGKRFEFRLYRPGLNVFEWVSLHCYPTKEKSLEAFESFIPLLHYIGNYNRHSISGSLEHSIQIANVLLDIRYDPGVHKKSADYDSVNVDSDCMPGIRDFLNLISQEPDMFYPFIDHENDCRFAFRLVNHHLYRKARYRRWFPSTIKRERARDTEHAAYHCRKRGVEWLECPEAGFIHPDLIDKKRIWRTPERLAAIAWQLKKFTNEAGVNYYSFQLVDNGATGNDCKVIWRSTHQYTGEEEEVCKAMLAEELYYVELLELARYDKNYWYDSLAGKDKQYRLYLKNDEGQVVAFAPEIICGDTNTDMAIRMINAMLYPVFRNEKGYSFEINKVTQRQAGNQYVYRYTTTWEGIQLYAKPKQALNAYKEALQLLADKRNYERVDHDACGPFGFELVDPGQVLSVHPLSYDSIQERKQAMDEVQRLISMEGFHVLEHILLRPTRRRATKKPWYIEWELYKPEKKKTGTVWLRLISRTLFENPEKQNFINALKRSLEADRVYIENQKKQFIVSFFSDAEELIATAHLPKNCCFPQLQGKRKNKNCEDYIDIDKVCKGITRLLKEKVPAATIDDVHELKEVVVDKEATGLLSMCLPENEPCPFPAAGNLVDDTCSKGFMVDPYSFRATVIVPSWPRRFRMERFRQFFERKLQEEVPSHVLLRVVWVSPCDMQKYETALVQWLKTINRKEGCDYESAQKELVKILMEIRNEYPDAFLFDENDPGGHPMAILDEVILS